MLKVWSAVSTAVVLLGVFVMLGSAPWVAAQDDTPLVEDEGMPEGVTYEILSIGSTDELPAVPADLQLYRVGLAPGASLEVSPDPAISIAYVETGAITMSVEGEVTVIRSPGPEGPEAVETFAAGEEFTLEATDSVTIPLRALGGALRNDGSEPASLLVVNVISFASFESEEEATPVP